MFNTLNYQSLRNDEFIQLLSDVLTKCEQNDPDALNIRIQFDALKAGSLKLENSYLNIRGSELTDNILTIDNVRDSGITGITFLAKGYMHHYNPDFVDAGKRLLNHIKKYGTNANSIAAMNYQAETTALKDLIDYVKNDTKLNAAVTLLGLTDWFTNLDENNIEFNRLYLLRIDEEADKTKSDLRELRKESLKQYRDLTDHLAANALINPSALYDTTINRINEIIDKYNNIRRKGKSEDDE